MSCEEQTSCCCHLYSPQNERKKRDKDSRRRRANMKTVSLLVAEADPGTVGDFEIIGAFSGDFELVQWLWTELKLRPGFSAWPIGGDRERAQDVEFLENVAELQLRPYHPAKAIAGLGPLSVRNEWIKQHNLEGDFNWLVVKYEIADIRAEEVQDYTDLRGVM